VEITKKRFYLTVIVGTDRYRTEWWSQGRKLRHGARASVHRLDDQPLNGSLHTKLRDALNVLCRAGASVLQVPAAFGFDKTFGFITEQLSIHSIHHVLALLVTVLLVLVVVISSLSCGSIETAEKMVITLDTFKYK